MALLAQFSMSPVIVDVQHFIRYGFCVDVQHFILDFIFDVFSCRDSGAKLMLK